jgi:hypothetical protein
MQIDLIGCTAVKLVAGALEQFVRPENVGPSAVALTDEIGPA